MFVEQFTRVECVDCGGAYSVFNNLDDDRYSVEYCSLCGSDDIETYEEEATE